VDEITAFGGLVLAVAGGFALALASTKLTERLPVPAPGIVLVLGAVASNVVHPIGDFLSTREVVRIGTVALIAILFDGGMDVGLRRFRTSFTPIALLGVVGTFATAALTAVFAHTILGFGWLTAWLVGAAIAPTDPAVMFSVLGSHEVRGRAATTLEGESGVNDPVGIALVVGLLDYATHAHSTLWVVPREFFVELAVGLAVGAAGGMLLVPLWRRIALPIESLYPVGVLFSAGIIYGAASVAHGSGFLAVFVAGLIVGDARVPFKAQVVGFHGTMASLAELVVFVALGLTVDLSSLGDGHVWLDGLVLVLLVAFVARPLAVGALLLPVRMTGRERAFVLWGGLKGAVPILLAAFTVMAGVRDAGRLYDIVFVVVTFSVFVNGGTIGVVARALHIPMRPRRPSPWRITVGLEQEPEDVRRYVVADASRANGRAVRDLPLGDQAWISIVVRHGRAIQPRGSHVLEPGDEVVVLVEPEDEAAVRRVFEGREEAAARTRSGL